MTMITGNKRNADARAERAFDAMVAGRESAATMPRPAAPQTIEDLMLEDTSKPRASFRTVALVSLAIAVIAAFIAFAVTALVASSGQPAGAVAAPATGDVTASVVEDQVVQGWAATGETGSATCSEPTSQEPGTAISCTGVFADSPIEFTAVIGDRAAGEEPVTITRWSNGTPG